MGDVYRIRQLQSVAPLVDRIGQLDCQQGIDTLLILNIKSGRVHQFIKAWHAKMYGGRVVNRTTGLFLKVFFPSFFRLLSHLLNFTLLVLS